MDLLAWGGKRAPPSRGHPAGTGAAPGIAVYDPPSVRGHPEAEQGRHEGAPPALTTGVGRPPVGGGSLGQSRATS